MEEWTLLLFNYSGPQITVLDLKEESTTRAVAYQITSKIPQLCAICINRVDGRVVWIKNGAESDGP